MVRFKIRPRRDGYVFAVRKVQAPRGYAIGSRVLSARGSDYMSILGDPTEFPVDLEVYVDDATAAEEHLRSRLLGYDVDNDGSFQVETDALSHMFGTIWAVFRPLDDFQQELVSQNMRSGLERDVIATGHVQVLLQGTMTDALTRVQLATLSQSLLMNHRVTGALPGSRLSLQMGDHIRELAGRYQVTADLIGRLRHLENVVTIRQQVGRKTLTHYEAVRLPPSPAHSSLALGQTNRVARSLSIVAAR